MVCRVDGAVRRCVLMAVLHGWEWLCNVLYELGRIGGDLVVLCKPGSSWKETL